MGDSEFSQMWFYTSIQGYVYRKDEFSYEEVADVFLSEEQDDNELVAVLKTTQTRENRLCGNEIKLLTKLDFQLQMP